MQDLILQKQSLNIYLESFHVLEPLRQEKEQHRKCKEIYYLRLQQVRVCHSHLLTFLNPLNAPHNHSWSTSTTSCQTTDL